jgi:hypothetical protein
MQSRTFIPRILDAFSRDIRPFDGVMSPTHDTVLDACRVIQHYTGLLQAADLSLSQRDAGAMLQARLNADRKARLPEIKAQVDALIAARP